MSAEKNRSVLFRKQNLFQFFFRSLSQRVPIFVGKHQVVLWESLVALPEELFEGKSFYYQKILLLRNQQKKESWTTCFRHECQNCFLRLNWKFLQRKKVLSEKISHLFVSDCEKKLFGQLAKRIQSSSKKVSWELKKLLSFLPKRVLEKLELFL